MQVVETLCFWQTGTECRAMLHWSARPVEGRGLQGKMQPKDEGRLRARRIGASSHGLQATMPSKGSDLSPEKIAGTDCL